MTLVNALVALSIFSIAAGPLSVELAHYARLNREISTFSTRLHNMDNAVAYLNTVEGLDTITSITLNQFLAITEERFLLALNCTQLNFPELSQATSRVESPYRLFSCSLATPPQQPQMSLHLLLLRK